MLAVLVRAMSIVYRLLHPEEWGKLNDIIPEGFLPGPDSAAAAVAETETGEILGVLFLQIALHCEPLIILDSSVNFKRLHDTIHAHIADRKGLAYYCFTGSEKVERMAKIVGFEPMSDKVWKKTIY